MARRRSDCRRAHPRSDGYRRRRWRPARPPNRARTPPPRRGRHRRGLSARHLLRAGAGTARQQLRATVGGRGAARPPRPARPRRGDARGRRRPHVPRHRPLARAGRARRRDGGGRAPGASTRPARAGPRSPQALRAGLGRRGRRRHPARLPRDVGDAPTRAAAHELVPRRRRRGARAHARDRTVPHGAARRPARVRAGDGARGGGVGALALRARRRRRARPAVRRAVRCAGAPRRRPRRRGSRAGRRATGHPTDRSGDRRGRRRALRGGSGLPPGRLGGRRGDRLPARRPGPERPPGVRRRYQRREQFDGGVLAVRPRRPRRAAVGRARRRRRCRGAALAVGAPAGRRRRGRDGVRARRPTGRRGVPGRLAARPATAGVRRSRTAGRTRGALCGNGGDRRVRARDARRPARSPDRRAPGVPHGVLLGPLALGL
ncbi:hypothetical protein SY89_00055 [Halolamina pelagica]|uniref:Uncharacterized protein n=1 Tax=Halolamina pelagica TaxID=699431 RepID=A0A0P7GL39_9EURY|nr:hypothetical protein SY89_00055 [Halolamina pelagica]